MPIRKKADGYYWGSKGPFKTRSEALKVQRAAHANGWKEKKPNGSKRKYSTKMKRGPAAIGRRG